MTQPYTSLVNQEAKIMALAMLEGHYRSQGVTKQLLELFENIGNALLETYEIAKRIAENGETV